MSERLYSLNCTLGDVAEESTARAGQAVADDAQVYGVDRSEGLTPDAKYASKNLARYKVLEPQMFAYNPMRLNIGSIAYCTEQHSAGLVSPDYVVFGCKPGKLDSKFFNYFIKGPDWQQWTTAAGVGSVRVRIYFRELARMPIRIPPLAEQKAIAAVLGALDDKIELNRRMNATLEAMARALFQSWFVDFDPVRAKMDGRKPAGMDAATADLFPDSFQDSEAGRIPRDWTVARVADVSDFSRTSINPSESHEETFDHYSLPAFDEGRTPKAELGSAIMSNKLVVTRSSVLLSKLNPHIPRIWLPDLHPTRRSVCSTEFIVASTRPGYSREFLFSLFTSAAFATTYGTLVTGTTGSHQRIRPESVLEMKTVIPPPKLVEGFTTIAKPMFDQINRNIEQSRTLATLRDTLVPKVLSGQVRIGTP
jgi:type I restriction enzyme S subunit